MKERIMKLLLTLGISPCMKGFQAMVCAIEMIMADQDLLNQVSKRLYPEVAEQCNTTVHAAERNIRQAVISMFDHHDHEQIVDVLGLEVNMHTGKYTNSEFLGLCALKLRMEDMKEN